MTKSIPSEMAPSAKQLVFWVMIATFVAVSIFLCGVLVGQGMPRRGDDSSRNGPLRDGIDPIDVTVPVGPSGSTGPTTLDLDELSYFTRLHSTGPVSEALSEQTNRSSGQEHEFATGSARVLRSSDGSPSGSFFLQITALRGGSEAREVVASLAAGGYPAFVVHPAPGTPVAMYWVRVGPYADRAAAEVMSRRLEAEHRFAPLVIQP